MTGPHDPTDPHDPAPAQDAAPDPDHPDTPETATPEPNGPETAEPDPAEPESAGPESAGSESAGPEPAGPEGSGPEAAAAAAAGTAPDDPERGRGAARGAWGAGGRGDARRHQEAYEVGAGVRALRTDIEDLRAELRRGLSGTRQELRAEFRSTASETAGYIAELLPWVHDLEDRVAALAAGAPTTASPTAGSTAAGAEDGGGTGGEQDERHDTVGPPPSAEGSGAVDDDPPITPATGWDAMDRATAGRAWAELARFVDRVLHRQYRLSRLQIPDCWPAHPRLVRELAWLRSAYLEVGEVETETPSSSMPWHIRALPGFLVNTADAVDVRECRPGVHRLTDPEVSAYTVALRAAHREGRPEPVLTRETGPDRPRLNPEHYPTRSTSSSGSPRDPSEGPQAPTTIGLPDLLAGSCAPAYWIDYYHEVSAADLDTRP